MATRIKFLKTYYNYWNEQYALNVAEIECGGKCISWLISNNTCGAIAEDSERHWGGVIHLGLKTPRGSIGRLL
jgi:hypothetical protein